MILYSDQKPSFKGGIERFCKELSEIYQFHDIFWIDRIGSICSLLNKKVINPYKTYNFLKKNNDNSLLITGFSSISVSIVILISFICNKRVVYAPYFHPFSVHRNPILAYVYFHLITRWLLLKIDTIILPNLDSKKFFQKYNKNIFCIPLWLNNFDKFETSSKKRRGILFVGRLEKNKGIHVLEKIYETIELKVVSVSNLKLNRKNVEYFNNVDDKKLHEIYRNSLITIIPSEYESFSFVQLESMLQGTPIMTSKNVKINENFNNDYIKLLDFENCDINKELLNFIDFLKSDLKFEKSLTLSAEALIKESKGKYLKILKTFD
tara:strand:- start:56 stop:1021 length:966 start_codon:yes stop_codon:yes gene_type:complete